MSLFHIYSSNRQEILLDHLVEILRSPLPNPMATEYIMVQHQGIQRWLSIQLALKKGILANTRFLFPNEVVELAFKKVIPGYGKALGVEHLQWRLFEKLLTLPNDSAFDILRRYQGENREDSAFQLAGNLAALFDQYEMFRPEMLHQWEEGQEEHWQARLWRSLPEETRVSTKPFILTRFWEELSQHEPPTGELPQRISIFGISYLPPLHLEVLKGLSRFVEIHFYFLNPCKYYWGDILSDKKTLQILSRKKGFSENELHLDRGNRLLSSFGQYGQDFFNLLFEKELTEEPDLFLPNPLSEHLPERSSLLQQIQSDIYHLTEGGKSEEAQGNPLILDWQKDDSLRFHSCHSRMREVEVLQDQLLRIFQEANTAPEDVLVMTPEIEEYAPIIQAVFGNDPNDSNYVPYAIADRVFLQKSTIVQFFLNLLDMPKSRYTLPDVLAPFQSDSVKLRFQLEDTELDLIQRWLKAVNIRWGIDAAFRESKGVPPTYEHTWEFGIDRILTGFAIPGKEQTLIQERRTQEWILPFDDIEGSNALGFARFLDYFEALTQLVRPGEMNLLENLTLDEWAQRLENILTNFFAETPDWESELLTLRDAFDKLASIQTETEFGEKVNVDIIRSYLQSELSGILQQGGFLGHGITFCSMKPMRSVPFKVIVLLGMNDKAFPRIDRTVSFDLSGPYLRGDRSVKGEDRYLFLEILLSAREKLYCSYIGQNIKDNTPLSPSTVLGELIDYVKETYPTAREREAKLITRHPLQAFNTAYFKGANSTLFSFSQENFQAAKTFSTAPQTVSQSLEQSLSEPDAAFFTLRIAELIQFFTNPAKYLFQHRLGIFLQAEESLPEENEPFQLDNLSSYLLEDSLIQAFMQEPEADLAQKAENVQKLSRSKGELPHAIAGKLLFKGLEKQVTAVFTELQPFFADTPLEPYAYDIAVGKFRLRGTIYTAREGSLLRFRPSGIKFKDRFTSWLEHLILNYARPEGYPLVSTLIGTDKKANRLEIYRTEAIADAQAQLQTILEIYEKGLVQPLAFFPRSALAYMDEYQKFGSDTDETIKKAKAAQKALAIWQGDFNPFMESEENPYFSHCFAGLDLFAATDFEANVLELLKPAFENQKKDED